MTDCYPGLTCALIQSTACLQEGQLFLGSPPSFSCGSQHDANSTLEQEVDGLQVALESRIPIGKAMGVIIEREGVMKTEAFAMLKTMSQHRLRRLLRAPDPPQMECERGDSNPHALTGTGT
jgi:hypothetical protein